MHEFYDRSHVANTKNLQDLPGLGDQAVAQRKLDDDHAAALAKYILKGLFAVMSDIYQRKAQTPRPEFNELRQSIGSQPYMALQPITANIRACKFGGADLRLVKSGGDGGRSIVLSNHHVLWVIDGQHRREAMNLVTQYLREIVLKQTYPKKPHLHDGAEKGSPVPGPELEIWNEINDVARSTNTVAVEVHLGLNPEQERQLFFDLNNHSRKVEAGLSFEFDQSNPINLFIKEELIGNAVLKATVNTTDSKDWHKDNGGLSLKDLVAINSILFLNKNNPKGASPSQVAPMRDFGVDFWTRVGAIPSFGEPGAKKLTVAAQPVVLKAIAKLFYTFRYSKKSDGPSLVKLVQGLQSFDFGHLNLLWRYYLIPPGDREASFPGLAQYLPTETEGANRDIGSFHQNDEVFRFGIRHNDIYPIIGDMIRYSLKLPSRHSV